MQKQKTNLKAVALATQKARLMDKESHVVSTKSEASIPRFDRAEIRCSKQLGTGSFNRVWSLKKIELVVSRRTATNKAPIQRARRKEMAKNPQNYAVKLLKDTSSPKRFIRAAVDLLTEAKLLASLNHPNIIELHGIACHGARGFAEPGGFFIILDRLESTLEEKMDDWITERDTSLGERMEVLVPLADSLKYLHSKGCVFRDLKPANVGFDQHGTLKLFDFGLVCELKPRERMVGRTGTILYMAPEVYKREPYNAKADIYSFSILMFEIMSCARLIMVDYEEKVILGGARPRVSDDWPTIPTNVIKYGWSEDPDRRPPMEVVHSVLMKYQTSRD